MFEVEEIAMCIHKLEEKFILEHKHLFMDDLCLHMDFVAPELV